MSVCLYIDLDSRGGKAVKEGVVKSGRQPGSQAVSQPVSGAGGGSCRCTFIACSNSRRNVEKAEELRRRLPACLDSHWMKTFLCLSVLPCMEKRGKVNLYSSVSVCLSVCREESK